MERTHLWLTTTHNNSLILTASSKYDYYDLYTTTYDFG